MHGDDDSDVRSKPSPCAAAPAGSAERQLLFGIIALQSDFLTREQLVAGFDAWVHDKSRTLVAILVEQGALSAEDRDILERLVGKFVAKHAGDAERSLAALSSVAQVRLDLARLNDPELMVSLGHVATESLPEDNLGTTLLQTGGSSLGRFRILRPHAKGGLGQVSVALDQDLNREVALKEIQPQHADDRVSRERFLLEAEITGGLEHPGIVPVYALGQGPAGRPFYAMRFVKGDSLKQAIEVFHKPDNPHRHDPGARQLALRQLLGRFIDVCNAMEYAHSRGVLHRDLKPANIMVGKYGETLVVDWGLAKSVGKGEIVSDEATLRPSSALSSSGQTQPGSAIGTPAYMSPEQAAGKLDDLSPASDVYSLGATLYHLLCGKPPFNKSDIADVLRSVQQGNFPKPHAIEPETPAAMEAICLKAMSLAPANRYQSARALADDLEHWMADEPISAAPDSPAERLGRVARRHKGVLRAASLAAMLIGVIVVANVVQRSWDVAQHASEMQLLAHSEAAARIAAEKSQTLAEERKVLAEGRAQSLQAALAANLFERGLREYDAGRLQNGLIELTQAFVAAGADSPLKDHYGLVLADRCRQGGKQLAPPLWHADSVSTVAFSPDGTRVVTGSWDQSARLWDALSGAPLGTAMLHDGAVTCARFSPDGTIIVTGSIDSHARLWDAQTGKLLAPPIRHGGSVGRLDYSPDGTRLVTASDDGAARLWDGRTGSPARAEMRHEGAVHWAGFNADGTRIVTGGWDNCARLWDGQTGAPIGPPLSHSGPVTVAAFSPDGSRVVTGGHEPTVRLWDVQTGTAIGSGMVQEGFVQGIAFSPDGARIATTSDDRTLRVWDGQTGAPLINAIRRSTPFVCVAFSPDGTRIAAGGGDYGAGSRTGFIGLWNALTGEPIGEPLWHSGFVAGLAFSRDGTRIATASWDRSARLWSVVAGTAVGPSMEHDSAVTSVLFQSDGETVETRAWGNIAQLWDAHTRRPIDPPAGARRLIGDAAVSPDGALVVAVAGVTATICDARTRAEVGAKLSHGDAIECAAFSPDGVRLITGSKDGQARLWNARDGTPVGSPMQHDGPVYTVAFSPDGNSAVTGSDGGDARLWNARTGASLGVVLQHDGGLNCLAYSPEGERLATGADDHTARLWDASTGAPLAPPMRHDHDVECLAFSPDGRRLATGSNDGFARLWDARTGARLGVAMKHDFFVWGVGFNPDGNRLVTGCADSHARIWDVWTPSREALDAVDMQKVAALWSGVLQEGAGQPAPLSPLQLEDLRRQLGHRDPLMRKQIDPEGLGVGK
ncbi:MAG: WD40 repeat domain-containing serine/threonine protein kinase [Planctomycetales bacterium]